MLPGPRTRASVGIGPTYWPSPERRQSPLPAVSCALAADMRSPKTKTPLDPRSSLAPSLIGAKPRAAAHSAQCQAVTAWLVAEALTSRSWPLHAHRPKSPPAVRTPRTHGATTRTCAAIAQEGPVQIGPICRASHGALKVQQTEPRFLSQSLVFRVGRKTRGALGTRPPVGRTMRAHCPAPKRVRRDRQKARRHPRTSMPSPWNTQSIVCTISCHETFLSQPRLAFLSICTTPDRCAWWSHLRKLVPALHLALGCREYTAALEPNRRVRN